VSDRVRLRHQIERAATRASDPAGFFDELRRAGVLVKERHSQHNPDEITGYAVALPQHQPGREPVWHSGGKLAGDLSLPRLQARWNGQEPAPNGRTKLSTEERQAIWDEATEAATSAAAEIRQLARTDPAGASDTARAAADLLRAAARVAEPSGQGRLSAAAAAYDRASRDLYGRTPPPGQAAAGDLRLAALALTLVRRAAPSDGAAVASLIVALGGLLEAVGDLRAAQDRHHQATAAYRAAEPLRAFTAAGPSPAAQDVTRTRTSTTRPGPEPPSRGRAR
jgi:hypothetical protein